MNSRQQAFVEAYCCNGFNATQAAITAGYSERSSEMTGSRLMSNDKVSAAVDKLKSKGAERALVTIEDVVRGFLKEAKGEQDDTTSPARNAAWKELSNYTGGFDANVRKVALDTDVVFNMQFMGDKGDE
jgi:phage terminase small subunit